MLLFESLNPILTLIPESGQASLGVGLRVKKDNPVSCIYKS
jgi:hypothetical protein